MRVCTRQASATKPRGHSSAGGAAGSSWRHLPAGSGVASCPLAVLVPLCEDTHLELLQVIYCSAAVDGVVSSPLGGNLSGLLPQPGNVIFFAGLKKHD